MGPAKQDQRATFTLTKQLLHRSTILQLFYILHDDLLLFDMYSALTKKCHKKYECYAYYSVRSLKSSFS